jgi:hypothetical protein
MSCKVKVESSAKTSESTSYWEQNEQTADQGTVIALFDGTHG